MLYSVPIAMGSSEAEEGCGEGYAQYSQPPKPIIKCCKLRVCPEGK